MGVAVAEKEWLAHDVIMHSGERDALTFDALDVTATGDQSFPEIFSHAAALKARANLQNHINGRLNLTFMWQCVASVADFVGESYLARMYWNLASESRFMIEALTPYTFQLFEHSKWEVTIVGVILKTLHTFILVWVCVFYCGTYFQTSPLPLALMGTIGMVAFIHSILRIMESLSFAFNILGAGQSTTRHRWVSESVVVVIFLAILINIGIWLYLVPMMNHWDLPIGQCNNLFNKYFFRSACP